MSRTLQWLTTVSASGVVSTAAFSMTAQPLATLSVVEISFWLAAGLILTVAILSSIVLIDLKRVFVAAPGVALVATVLYAGLLWSPAMSMPEYSSHLLNYALVQSVPVFIVTLLLSLLGSLIGTILNASFRELEL